jgi:hypothetical protein
MRIPQLILALAGTLMCPGCSELVGLHPFVTDKEAALDARLLGVWVDDDDLYRVRQDGNGYTIGYSDKKSAAGARHKSEGFAQMPVNRENPSVGNTPIRAPTHFYVAHPSAAVYKLNAKMLKVGETRILDLMAEDEDPFQIAAHTPLRVWLEGATLRMAFLDSKWLREHASAQLAVRELDKRLLIMSPGEEVTRFLPTYGADDRAYGKPTVLTKQE